MSKINVGRIAFHPPRVFVRDSIRLLYLGNHGSYPYAGVFMYAGVRRGIRLRLGNTGSDGNSHHCLLRGIDLPY